MAPPPDAVERDMGVFAGYTAPGPVAQAFIHSKKSVTGIMGPVAGGKTIASLMKGVRVTARQPIAIHDGVKHCKIVAVADTYGNIWDKLLPSFRDMWPEDVYGKIKGATNNKADVEHYFADSKGNGKLHIHWQFRAIGDGQSLASFIGGLQPTCVYLYEATFLPAGALGKLAQRLGRWPPGNWFKEGDFPQTFVWADFNAPNETHELYRRLALNPGSEDQLFVQPSGFAPNAENVEYLHANIHPDFYRNRAAMMNDPAEIARMIENKPGYDRTGKPVYANYDDQQHAVSAEMKPEPGQLVVVGIDGGLLAGALYGQPDRKELNRIRFIAEDVTEPGTTNSAAEFGARVKARLASEFAGCPAVGVGDPTLWQASSAAGHTEMGDKKTWMSEFMKASGLYCIPAPSNNWTKRYHAVNWRLSKLHQGYPLFQINKRCVMTREGFLGGYRFKRTGSELDVGYSDRPDKTGKWRQFTEPHDAVQYVCLAVDGAPDALNRALMRAVDQMGHNPRRKAKVYL